MLNCILGFPATASSFEETEGIRFGSFSIHPSVFTSLRYVDNIYFVSTNYEPADASSVPQGIESDYVFNITPAALFRFKRPRFKAEAGYKLYNDNYLGTDDPDNRHSKLNAANHTFNGLVDYQTPVGLFVGVDDTYIVQQSFEDSAQYVDLIVGDQEHNAGHGILGFKHGPEDNFYVTAKYTTITDRYGQFNEFDRDGWFADGDLRLKFLPKTALLLKAASAPMTTRGPRDRAPTFSTAWAACRAN
ncbi:MAG: hypothetical protein M5R36_19400 [Deltaproteobacteria bacterium]|nr:hypothetical protein [Deltaproteobacteria bacterium]